MRWDALSQLYPLSLLICFSNKFKNVRVSKFAEARIYLLNELTKIKKL